MGELDLATQELRKNLDKNWSFYHSYIAKLNAIRKYLEKKGKNAKVLDAGCGEGKLVEEFSRHGYDMVGLDANYESTLVKKGDVLHMPFSDNTFDVVLCLDVIEHLHFPDQPKLLKELKRVVKEDGEIVFSIPNQAHLSSRFTFLFLGRLLRTAKIEYHPGDRPIIEYLTMIKKAGLRIKNRRGIGASIPVLFQLTQLLPRYTGWLYWLLSVFHAIPGWCFLNIIVCDHETPRKAR